MVKRDVSEIVKSLNVCAKQGDIEGDCQGCSYRGMLGCFTHLAGDASIVIQTLQAALPGQEEKPVITELTRPPIPPRKSKLKAAETDFDELDRMMRGNYYKPSGGGV